MVPINLFPFEWSKTFASFAPDPPAAINVEFELSSPPLLNCAEYKKHGSDLNDVVVDWFHGIDVIRLPVP